MDSISDLALLAVEVDLTSSPLSLASGTLSPGEQVFAIGNPEGSGEDNQPRECFRIERSR